MTELYSSFLSKTFLRSVWELDYAGFRHSDEERALEERLRRWHIHLFEDALMKPLVSGPEAKRYVEPQTETYLLFPYVPSGNSVALIDPATMQRDYPRAWSYLQSYYDHLRLRESSRDSGGNLIALFNDERWYRFGRHQNMNRHEIVKLIVAQTVTEMRVCLDDTASLYLNNVRVNGIIPSENENP
jgi:hypothetical protein